MISFGEQDALDVYFVYVYFSHNSHTLNRNVDFDFVNWHMFGGKSVEKYL